MKCDNTRNLKRVAECFGYPYPGENEDLCEYAKGLATHIYIQSKPEISNYGIGYLAAILSWNSDNPTKNIQKSHEILKEAKASNHSFDKALEEVENEGVGSFENMLKNLYGENLIEKQTKV